VEWFVGGVANSVYGLVGSRFYYGPVSIKLGIVQQFLMEFFHIEIQQVSEILYEIHGNSTYVLK
jgi:hypothetical protein